MELSPLHPPTEKRPLSESTRGWIHPTHPLLGTQGRVRIRAHFTITDWLLMGGILQSVIILLLPIRPFYALLPTFGLAIFKVTRLVLKIYGLVENPLMEGVKHGRLSAVFPPAETGEKGTGMMRQVGGSVGGGEMCILLLSNRCTHPLGLFYSKYREMGTHAKAMFTELERSPLTHGFLGYTDYSSNNVPTQPHSLSIMYFKSISHVHAWAHSSPAHRAAWEWWDSEQKAGRIDHLTIAHEIYGVEEGKWENIYVNARPFGFAETSHAIVEKGGRKLWACPAMDASRSFRTSGQRLGNVRG
ncbi:hypothetical protein ONS95_002116 [Cadophora gregata]|uniref:uncharacterized protein n=1 Tax=Cadophora gregata TaxID=51156 RepID=UPI0026DCA0EA|nr:uncharacterized protein ONS95_002116 [Cadophora gregata]KAK0109419.1 hypothetical protein ONS95_002116 [Cadophora gregata]KAK0110952.1 hypothetical protein ONS96_002536 [Cadophora gregata f. sp. sojae]